MRPNIMVIMTDEQRYDCVGYRNSDVKTPNLDALKADSICFNNAYTTNPSCVPARAAMFSGKYPSQCGAPAYITPLEKNERTFMSRLQDAGYYTSVIGKQHFAGYEGDYGYDYMNIVDSHFANFEEENGYMRFLARNGIRGLDQLMERDGRYSWKWIADEKLHVDSYVGDCGAEWIEKESVKINRPWFFTLSFLGPHMPYNGAGLEIAEQYDENTISLPRTKQSDLEQKPDYYMEQIRSGKGNPGQMPVIDATEEEIRHTRKAYYSDMSLIDKKIGEAVAKLKETGQYDNTVIFFVTDHGDYMGDFGMFGKGQYLSEVLMRIPFLMKPAVKGYPGKEVENYVMNFDIAPTCLEFAEVPVPEEMSAKSLCRFVDEYVERPETEYLYMEASNVRAVQNQEWKLIYYQNREYGELYHLSEDPDEIQNLYEDENCSAVKAALMQKLCDKMIELGRNSQSPWNYAAPVI